MNGFVQALSQTIGKALRTIVDWIEAIGGAIFDGLFALLPQQAFSNWGAVPTYWNYANDWLALDIAFVLLWAYAVFYINFIVTKYGIKAFPTIG